MKIFQKTVNTTADEDGLFSCVDFDGFVLPGSFSKTMAKNETGVAYPYEARSVMYDEKEEFSEEFVIYSRRKDKNIQKPGFYFIL